MITVLSGKEFYFEYPNGDKMCTVIVLFKVPNYSGSIKVSDGESKELKFFPLTNLPVMEARAAQIIQKILDGTIKLKVHHGKHWNQGNRFASFLLATRSKNKSRHHFLNLFNSLSTK